LKGENEMLSDHDQMEDLPFVEGSSGLSDWTGLAWKEIPVERVKYLVHTRSKESNIESLLSQVPVGSGLKQENIPNMNRVNSIRNTLYKTAKKVWGTKSSDGKVRSNIRVAVTKDEETGTYQIEFVHLPPKDKNDAPSKIGNRKSWEEEQGPEDRHNDALYSLCLKHQGQWVTGVSIYNALKRGDINTLEDLKRCPLEDIEKIRTIGQRKLEIISQMKKDLEK